MRDYSPRSLPCWNQPDADRLSACRRGSPALAVSSFEEPAGPSKGSHSGNYIRFGECLGKIKITDGNNHKHFPVVTCSKNAAWCVRWTVLSRILIWKASHVWRLGEASINVELLMCRNVLERGLTLLDARLILGLACRRQVRQDRVAVLHGSNTQRMSRETTTLEGRVPRELNQNWTQELHRGPSNKA